MVLISHYPYGYDTYKYLLLFYSQNASFSRDWCLLSNFLQQRKEMQEAPKHKQISYCELCARHHPTIYCALSGEEVIFLESYKLQLKS